MTSEQSSAVRAGIFVVVCGAIMVLAIVALGQRTQLFQPRYTLVTRFPNAYGLIPGADVRVAGVNAGTVRSVQIEAGPREQATVKVILDIATTYRRIIRQGSRASIRTIGPLGDKYVEISPGPFDQPELQPGDFIPPEDTADFYELAEQTRQALLRVNAIAADVGETLALVDKKAVVEDFSATVEALRGLLEGARKGPGLVNRLLYDPNIPKMVQDFYHTAQTLRALVEDVRAGRGGLGQLMAGKEFERAVEDLAQALASARAILKEIQSGQGTAHALVYDQEGRRAITQVGDAADRAAALMAQIQEGSGTLGLLISDPGVWESLKRLLNAAEESRVLKYLVARSVRQGEHGD